MHEQLRKIGYELRGALDRAQQLVATTLVGDWGQRPEEGSWSVGECFAHLNMTSEATLPHIRSAMDRLEPRRGNAPGRYRRDVLGWIIWRSQAEGMRIRTKTSPAFVPGGAATPTAALERFEDLQRELLELVNRADGLPLTAVKIQSAFNAKVRYNVFSALSILSVHHHRHLGQAERAAAAVVERKGG
ncbi:hypothetical protein BH23GEM8_BH23GEM8_21280 [soil metagenome]